MLGPLGSPKDVPLPANNATFGSWSERCKKLETLLLFIASFSSSSESSSALPVNLLYVFASSGCHVVLPEYLTASSSALIVGGGGEPLTYVPFGLVSYVYPAYQTAQA